MWQMNIQKEKVLIKPHWIVEPIPIDSFVKTAARLIYSVSVTQPVGTESLFWLVRDRSKCHVTHIIYH